MAQTTLIPGVETISGRVGDFIFRTYTRNGQKQVRVYMCKPGSYRRRTKVSKKEKQQRQRFTVLAQEVARRIKAGDKRPKKLIWAEVKEQLTGDS